MADYIEDGAVWWLARSDNSVRALQRAFDDQEVACMLYERVGAIIEQGRSGDQFLIAIQLVRDPKEEWMLDVSLCDAGIYLDEIWKGD